MFIRDLFDVCKNTNKNKKILLLTNASNGTLKDKTYMLRGHYIVDNIWCSEFCKLENKLNISNIVDSESFIDELERECLDFPTDWGNLYQSPMENLCDVELRFYCDMVYGYDNGENYYVGKEIKEDENYIYIILEKKINV